MEVVRHYIKVLRQMGREEFLATHSDPFFLFRDCNGGKNAADPTIDPDALNVYRVLTPGALKTPANPNQPRKLLVGSGPDRDVSIDHATVSARHAFIAFDPEQKAYRLGDAGSEKGTYLNGEPVEVGNPVYIKAGNTISFGDCNYLFFTPEGFADLIEQLIKS
jgi:pSer/pThr/pTyr-binding forkhead associated (FHA) protein